MAPRVRFPPSPTGEPHVGNIRTALFNWLFARNQGGAFILRIEDTDRQRLVPGAQEAILEGLRWLGLDWDEGPEKGGDFGPYIQSERKELGIYDEAARRLIESGRAYECYCPPERLDEVRKLQQQAKVPPMYDRLCREADDRERMRRQQPGAKPVVRFKAPFDDGGETGFTDLVMGDVSVANRTMDDFVLLKSDGYPTYHLANVVDDHMMEITHVMRGDDWIPSTPRHILLYRALGWQPPPFAHFPQILGPDRGRLSKRHGATGVREYRDQGYLPEAMINFLALLGWSLDDKTELLSRSELVRYFGLERVGKTAAVFNREKLEWMNGVYIRGLSAEDLAKRLLPYLERPEAEGGLPDVIMRPIDRRYLVRIVPLIQERVKVLKDASSLVDFFFADELIYDSVEGPHPLASDQAVYALESTLERLRHLEFDRMSLEDTLRDHAESIELKTGVLFGIIRFALTARKVSPPLFETMEVLGRERCLYRLEKGILAARRLTRTREHDRSG